MGYEIHFTPSAEKMETYKPWGYDKPNYQPEEKHIEETRLELLTYCLKKHDDSTSYQVQKQIEFYLRLLAGQIEINEKEFAYKRWSEDEDHELWYCGWEFARNSLCDLDTVIQGTVENLLIISYVIETPNYFSDRDNFWEKHRAISDYIADFKSIVEEYYIHQIIEDLREFEKKYDDEESDYEGKMEEIGEQILHDKDCKIAINDELEPGETENGQLD